MVDALNSEQKISKCSKRNKSLPNSILLELYSPRQRRKVMLAEQVAKGTLHFQKEGELPRQSPMGPHSKDVCKSRLF